MKKFKIIFFGLSLLILAAGCNNEEIKEKNNSKENSKTDKKVVYTSNYPIYDFTKKISGDKLEVINLIKNGESAHHWEPSAQDIKSLSESDMFIYNGAGLENWVESLLDSDSVPKITVEASKDLDLIENHHDEHDEHDHGMYDPHTWLSLKNAEKMLENILEGIVELDPENKEYYKENFENWKNKFEELDEKYKKELAEVENKTIVVSHEAYGYLVRDYNLNQLGIEGVNASGEPTAKKMEEIINFIKSENIKVIFYENTINPKIANIIAEETNAETKMLSPLESLTEDEIKNGEDYYSIMQKNLEKISEALK